ncbi:substrate-binding domain-containing protein [Spirosoma rhododendri]|uniref:histidine kinase n=1 Tax=Spirosoma rhododendri TaxID=2728024 RepID=A0A7L5DUB4_9BACT|nr:substrate-binding domain-containing protein [Spirosoma rhododendri]QJD80188.1 substrate-binding domain-containing protein [Spirosoma rhododendri]
MTPVALRRISVSRRRRALGSFWPAMLGTLWMGWLLTACQTGEQKPLRIGFSQRTMTDNWRRTMLAGMKLELSFHPNIDLIVKDANGQSGRQAAQIQQLIDEQVDLLIVSPNEARPITPIVEKAYQQGIPVVILDRRTASDAYTAYVGADNVEVGRTAGMYAGSVLNGQGNVVEIGESPGSSADIDRHRGFLDAIAKRPGIRLVAKLAGDWDKQSFDGRLTQLLNTRPDIRLIFAQNDRSARKSYSVCRQLGLTRSIRIIGVDGLPGPDEGIDLVDRGTLTATVLYPTGGKEAIRTAVAILNKQPFKRENRLPTTLIDSSNVQITKLQDDRLMEQQADIQQQSRYITDLTQTYASQKTALYSTLVSLLIVVGLAIWAFYLVRARQVAYRTLERQNAEILEQKNQIEVVSQQARTATEDKLRFYSYISHEFNTPLGLILTPTEELLTKKNVSPQDIRRNLSLVQKNAYRLLRLVDQLLDLRKADASKLRLKAAEQDLIAFTRDIIQDFGRKAERQRIDLRLLTSNLPALPVWFDAEKLDKVLFNLLSNAFKYTPKGGFIHVQLSTDGQQAFIKITDNGDGMTPDEQAHAFDLFYSGPRPFDLAKGVGLSLSLEFIRLHRGDIQVTSAKGRGTSFVVQLPLGNAHLDAAEQLSSPRADHALPSQLLIEPADELPTPPVTERTRPTATLLIIEDNDELRTYLASRLSDEFDVVAEATAEQGWERTLETIPDLIISDIMLPGLNGLGLDGMQFTQRVKSDLRTSHIPVVLLTAKRQIEQQIEGTRAGADVYITKPFNMTHLIETLHTTLANREKWQRRYASDFLAQSPATPGNRQDKKFLNELTGLIEQNLTEPAFGVEKLSRDMGLSRVQLYRKVQALLNMNVIDYVTEIRLKKAKRLLTESTKTMGEIAQETGFNSPAYFTTFFKQHTQKTPSEFRRSTLNA